MKDFTAGQIEREVVTLTRLVETTIDRASREVAVPERANCSVTYHGYVVRRSWTRSGARPSMIRHWASTARSHVRATTSVEVLVTEADQGSEGAVANVEMTRV